MRVVLAALGPADPDTAWERYARTGAWAGWSPQIAGVDLDDPLDPLDPAASGDLAAGATGRVRGPAGLRVAFTVDAVDAAQRAGRRWSWTVVPQRAGVPLPAALRRWAAMHLEHAVLPAEAGSLTTLVLTGRAPVVLVYAPLARLALGRLVR